MKWAEAAALELIDEAIQPSGRLIRPRGSLARRDATGARRRNPHRPRAKSWGTRLQHRARDTAVVWVLERSRPELRQRLREADENFVDPAGWVRLHLPGLLVDRSDLERVRRPPGAETRRSFSKMSSFDFAMTVAIGSLIAATMLTPDPPLLQAAAALAALYLLQIGVAWLRVRSEAVGRTVDNEAVLLMEDGRIPEDALKKAAVTRSDLIAKLREANVLRLEQVRAVVTETTGDISVLHAEDGDDRPVDDAIHDGVRGA